MSEKQLESVLPIWQLVIVADLGHQKMQKIHLKWDMLQSLISVQNFNQMQHHISKFYWHP